MRRTRGLVAVVALTCGALWPTGIATAGGGCHSNATQGSGDTVAMSEMCFTPSVLQVDAGTEVRFVNKDFLPHNVSAPWGSDGDLQEGDSFTATFENEGTFPYACMYHYGMTGAIVVGDGSGPATGASVEPGSVVDTTPISQESAASPQPNGSGILGWTIAGTLGLILGAGMTTALRRGRQED
jgi:plastocyanin